MTFTPIDLETYPRREHYEHFLRLELTYSATVPIDITNLRQTAKARNLRIYPAQIWLLTTAANRIPEFRMSHDAGGNLGVWDHLNPLYTILHQHSQTFSGIWTPYAPDFGIFSRQCLADIDTWNDGKLAPQGTEPPNALNISSIPWVGFTAFNLNLMTNYLLPILTIGKHTEEHGRTLMPLSIQVHHAVCDGFHLGRFVEEVQQLAGNAANWIG